MREKFLSSQSGSFDNVKEGAFFHVAVVFRDNDKEVAFYKNLVTSLLAMKSETYGLEYSDHFIRF